MRSTLECRNEYKQGRRREILEGRKISYFER